MQWSVTTQTLVSDIWTLKSHLVSEVVQYPSLLLESYITACVLICKPQMSGLRQILCHAVHNLHFMLPL
jgi:hypothetical protein